MKKVLIISHAYPPALAVASLRAGKIAKYLPEFGWEPIILTVKRDGRQIGPEDELKFGEVIRTRDFYIFSEIEKITKIFKKRTELLKHHSKTTKQKSSQYQTSNSIIKKYYFNVLENVFCFPDAINGWYFIVRKDYKNLFKDHKIDMIFSSSGPFTDHLIGSFLKSRFNVPWIADFRDLWTQGYIFKRWFLLGTLERILEKNTISKCDLITTVSEPFAQELSLIHNKKLAVITNGFDEEDYRQFSHKKKNDKFTLVYTGNIYQGKQDPLPLLMAIKNLISEGKVSKDEIVVNYFGRRQPWVETIVEDLKMKDLVFFNGIISFQDSIKKQVEADALILLFSKHKNEQGWIPAKLFEYLGAERTIIATGCKNGAVDKILKETGTGMVMNKTENIMNMFLEWINLWRRYGRIDYHGNAALISSKYSRRSQTRQLANLFDEFYEN